MRGCSGEARGADACVGVRACVCAALLRFVALLLTPPPLLCSLAQLLVTPRRILNIVSGQKVRARLQCCSANGWHAAHRARAAPSAACARGRGQTKLKWGARNGARVETGRGSHRVQPASPCRAEALLAAVAGGSCALALYGRFSCGGPFAGAILRAAVLSR